MQNLEQQIVDGAARMGLALQEGDAAALAAHAELVLQANATMNLTSIPAEEFAGLHVLDSLTALPFLMAAPDGPFADIGSGAGYPGIPLAICSRRSASLVESVRKKATFLGHVLAELRLKATVHPIRAEELALASPGAFSAVTARAVSALPSLVELAAPLLSSDGLLICLKGSPAQDEVDRGDAVARRVGMVRVSTENVAVPFVEGRRTILVYRRSGRGSVRLPRRPGMAQRQPLA